MQLHESHEPSQLVVGLQPASQLSSQSWSQLALLHRSCDSHHAWSQLSSQFELPLLRFKCPQLSSHPPLQSASQPELQSKLGDSHCSDMRHAPKLLAASQVPLNPLSQ